MAKTPQENYLSEVTLQREIWQKKPVLREIYHFWYQQIVNQLSPHRPVVEIGSGCGNFKAFFPEVISTDVFKSGEWIDRVMDAHQLDFAPGEVGNIISIDVIHHLQRPLNFLRQASEALKPGGRLILCEPAVSLWSRLVYRQHHEPLDPDWDLFGLADHPPDPDPNHMFANMGIGEILFFRKRDQMLAAVPSLKLISARKFCFLTYPLSGGFNYPSLIPTFGLSTLLKAEDILTRPFANWLTGLRMLCVLEKLS